MSERFNAKKQDILKKLSVTESDYEDASPKGSVDEDIRDLVNEINDTRGFVTTSSCSGRIAVFLEGLPKLKSDGLTERLADAYDSSNGSIKMTASTGGKGGGRWLFTSHEKLELDHLYAKGALFDWLGFSPGASISYPKDSERPQFVHFKFEPMILHILTESPKEAQLALNAAMVAGFRESGISSVLNSKDRPAQPMVAVRSSGLTMDSIIGFVTSQAGPHNVVPMVAEPYLATLTKVANERFLVNSQRMQRFREAFKQQVGHADSSLPAFGSECESTFEPADVRRERKRKDGLLRQEAMRSGRAPASALEREQSDIGGHDSDDEAVSLGLLGVYNEVEKA